jgi:hypothetical protein
MKKREFLKNSAILTIGALTVPSLLQSCNPKSAALITEKEQKIKPVALSVQK